MLPQATKNLNSPLVGLFSFGLVGLGAISLGYLYQELSFKRTRQLLILALVDVVLNDKTISFRYVLIGAPRIPLLWQSFFFEVDTRHVWVTVALASHPEVFSCGQI